MRVNIKRLPLSFSLSPSLKLFWTLFAPIFTLSLFFCIFIFIYRIHDLTAQLENKAKNITHQLAITSEYAISTSNEQLISQLLEHALSYGNINNITVFNQNKEVSSEIGPAAHLPTPPLTEQTYSQKSNSYLVTTQAIYLNSPPINDLGNQPGTFNNKLQPRIIGWVKVETNISQLNIAQYQLFFLLLFLFTVFNALCAYLVSRVTTALIQPSEKLSIALRKLTKGQYSAAKSIKLPAQYSETQKDLFELAERLENHKKELMAGIEQSTEDMRRNMDSMEEKSAQLFIANKEAMESNRLKSQFLANISHEVRTPLNAILGYTKILQKNVKDNQNKLYVDTIEQATNSLLAIIGDILDFSKIEAGKLSLDYSPINIRELVDEVYQTLSANLLTDDKQIDLVTDFSPDVPSIMIGDSIRIRQVLTNLISNALKFTNKGAITTKVMLSDKSADQLTLAFRVIDTGIGIAEDKINQLFKPFSQVDTSTTRKFGGTGLGLVITKKLVEQMGGTIKISSTPKIGSTFHFSLQLKPSNKPQPKPEKLDKVVVFLEPSNTYRHYLKNYFSEIGATGIACSGVEQVISKLNQQHAKIDAILVNLIPNKQNAMDAMELATYASTQFNIPCILMIQPPGQINHYPELKSICSNILLKPISHKHLFNTLQHIQPPNTLPAIEQTSHNEPPAPAISSKLTGLKILAVDDTQINLQLLSHWLTPHGLEIFLARSGQKAIDMAKEQQFDLILMDIQMPEMDGLETTQHLRSLATYKDTPIVALTAHALGSEQDRILASGMNAYLSKPVDEQILINTIEKWCLRKESAQQHINTQVTNAFDLSKALSIVNQKSDIAKEMFDMLADSLSDEKKLLKHHFELQDTEKLIHVVHRIHGASKYTGTIELTRHAGFLETHLKEFGMEDVEGVLNDFLESIDMLLEVRSFIPWPQE
ncbi:ATP-binding protein [Marinomonas pollencensis]|uniref:histidine kinase n=1 Tax=Marinomonas pollencensis TaxID=491954 RepID=A0A3E0DVP2_9GAMM|nr:ATP-binding protein [Marinomonas pollencensis]REG86915.1 two-component system sensor histidine kinase BarA [Marinomonas pollencensis]